MEREYLAIIENHAYIVTESADYFEPIWRVWPYHIGFADHYVREYIAGLEDRTVRQTHPGFYTDSRGNRWELEKWGQTTPTEALCVDLPYPHPKRKGEYRYTNGHWEKYTKTYGWEKVYPDWKPYYQPLLKIQEIKP